MVILRKIYNKKWLRISYILIIASFVFLVYVVLQSPYVRKIPYFGNQVYAWQLSHYARQFPAGSMERVRFEAMAEAIKNGQKEYTFVAPPSAIEMLSNQK